MDVKKDYLKMARRVLDVEGNALLAAASRIGDELNQAVDMILNSPGKVVVLGLGKSGHVAKKISATLCSTGTPSVFLHAAEALHGDLGIYRPGDPTILISKGGSTSELVRLVPTLREFESPLIGLLGNVRAPLARMVDIVLDASVPEEADPLGIVPTTSAVIAMAMGDALASALMLARDFKEQDFARFHPEGQLGRNLLLQVKDAMHHTRRVAVVTPELSLHEVVIRMTEYPLGAACVLGEGEKLIGIISDGDIRRMLQQHDDIRGLKAEDIMTKDPICALPEMTLGDAVRLMEDRPSQISVLPVKDPDTQVCLGLLRIHDVYQPHLA
tara:strand:- start:6088 stop:7071 length:984 start_codon:yes stop_codon:yes gene_type:complete